MCNILLIKKFEENCFDVVWKKDSIEKIIFNLKIIVKMSKNLVDHHIS